MNDMEKRQIEILEEQKEILIYQLMGAIDSINEQIKQVKAGEWYRKLTQKEVKDEGAGTDNEA